MIDPKQLRDYIITPTLRQFPDRMGGQAITELLLGTIFQESQCGQYIHQLGAGPALGICQMEPATAQDVWDRATSQPTLYASLKALMGNQPINVELVGNLYFSVAMARLKYWFIPAPLAAAGNIPGHAAYWKNWYNTPLGAGTTQEYMANWMKFSPYLG